MQMVRLTVFACVGDDSFESECVEWSCFDREYNCFGHDDYVILSLIATTFLFVYARLWK